MKYDKKAHLLESMTTTPGWKILQEYLQRGARPEILPVEGLNSIIKQTYKNGVAQGHQEVLDFIRITIDNGKRKAKENDSSLPLNNISIIKHRDNLPAKQDKTGEQP